MDGILLLGQKCYIWDIKLKIYYVPKSIPAVKSQNFVDIPGAQKPTSKIFGIWIFLSEKTRLHRYHQNKNELGVTSSSYVKLTMKLLIKFY